MLKIPMVKFPAKITVLLPKELSTAIAAKLARICIELIIRGV